ncbi:HesA/MoeB/ThiF family protein [Bythopirellula polymerisocia]|uniref:Molybdopterin-synthase adenylyltransferase n=1 Tax=Bythopirellula polymerisocia TaxID=2528003 RepID=A0A5C6CBF2_9BACT|nr:ThiF family adenylyltransferase [Bythopirellula polymerisocia]TWU20726.1 Molybdopterin-synthase adenylyltransferase [Bythopirellula polymerisocia]
MKRADNHVRTGFGHKRTLRMRRREADALCAHMRQDTRYEQMAFGLGCHIRTSQGTVFMMNELLLPGASDLAHQSAGGVTPTRELLAYLYFRASITRQDIMEFHSHPGGGVPRFSGIDESHAYRDAKYLTEHLPNPVTLLMVVGNNQFDRYDALVWDRDQSSFHEVQRIEVLGRPAQIHHVGQGPARNFNDSAIYDRQLRIPGWNQRGLAQQRIGIVGLGGNGASLFQTLIAIGAAEEGFFVLVDPDELEWSNLPRIPYATPEHVGTPKVTLAAQWASHRNPAIPVYPYPCALNEQAAQDRLKDATVLFGCVDNDGARMVLNDLAVRSSIPLIDLGCDVLVDEQEVIAGGQVRVVLPGENACLVCCRGYDPAQAAIDLMDEYERVQHAAGGYVRNLAADATPSIANLNQLTAQAALSQFLALVNGQEFGGWDYFHIDQFSLNAITASTSRDEQCPCCGPAGNLGQGFAHEDSSETNATRLAHFPSAADSGNRHQQECEQPESIPLSDQRLLEFSPSEQPLV